MKRAALTCALSLIILVILSSPGVAAKETLSSSATAIITAPDTSESRLLVKFDMPTLPEGHEVYHAEIKFEISSLAEMTELEIYEVDRTWSAASVGWSDPWAEPGGDIRGKRLDSWMADHRTGDLVKFIVTVSASKLAAAPAANLGYLVVVAGEEPRLLPMPSASPELTVYSGPSRTAVR